VPTEFFPPVDNGRITMSVKVEQNTHVDQTVKVARQIDQIIAEKYPYIYMVSTSAGANSSNNAFAAMQTTGSHIINYNVRMPRLSDMERPTIFEIADGLRRELAAIPEIREFTVTPGGGGGPGGGGASTVEIKVFGHDINTAMATAKELQTKMSQLSTMRDAQLSREDLQPEFNVQFDRDKLAYYGLNASTIAQFIRNRIYGYECTKYREDGDEYDIVVRYAEPYRESIEDVENITLYTAQGRAIKLKEVATIYEDFASPEIERENRQRVVTVSGSVGAGVALGEAVSEVNAMLADYEVPTGLDLELGGSIEDQGEAFSDIGMLLILIVILVYIVMATQFESLAYPFIIMFTIPFAMSGVFIALWMSSTPLSLIALIGAIMLVGIVTKNGIVMVDYMNLLVERGSSVADAVIAGGKSRLRPVLMTSLTTILGMVPMAMGIGEGSETWQPMGISVVGGLLVSTFLTLFIVPALYAMMEGRKERKAARKAARQKEVEEFVRRKRLEQLQQNK
ncbi:MAG: efflux RND transporter permease subunit, partial [Alistipes sp.]|nr:efflux RND transporter permease subunit [Alistipes sp.]